MDFNKTADYILNQLKSNGADDAECSVSNNVKTEIYYESGKIGLVRTNFNNSVSIKAIKDKKKGVVFSNSLEQEELDKVINDVMLNMEAAKPDEAEGICDIPDKNKFSKGPMKADKNIMYDRLNEFIGKTKQKYPKISFDSITMEHICSQSLYKNTNGTCFESDKGFYVFAPMYMACEGGKSSSFNMSEVVFACPDVDLMTLGMTERLLEETEMQIETTALSGKFVGDIIVTPPCMEDILGSVEDNFLSDTALINKTSLYKDSIGKEVAPCCVSIYSAPTSGELASGYFVTGDGYAAKDMPIIENGVLKNFVLSRYGSKKTGLKRSDTVGGNYIMNSGSVSLEQMIKSTVKGLIVNRFSGGSPGADGDMTGVAKNSFLVENGEIKCAVSETMISGNLAEMLKDITQISSERINNGDCILPWVKIKNITISGK